MKHRLTAAFLLVIMTACEHAPGAASTPMADAGVVVDTALTVDTPAPMIDAVGPTGWTGWEMLGVVTATTNFQSPTVKLARNVRATVFMNLHSFLSASAAFDVTIETIGSVGIWDIVDTSPTHAVIDAGGFVSQGIQVTPGSDASVLNLRIRATGPGVETSLYVALNAG